MASADALGGGGGNQRDCCGTGGENPTDQQQQQQQWRGGSRKGEENQESGTNSRKSWGERRERGQGDDTNDEGGQNQSSGDERGETASIDPRSVREGEKRENRILEGRPGGGEKRHLRHPVAGAASDADHLGDGRGHQESRGREKEGSRGGQKGNHGGKGKCQTRVDDGESDRDEEEEQQPQQQRRQQQQQQDGRAANGLAGSKTTDGHLGESEGSGNSADRGGRKQQRKLFEGKRGDNKEA